MKPTTKQLKIMREYWEKLQSAQGKFLGEVRRLENLMSRDCMIKDMEFFMVDNDYVGIGDGARKLELTQREKLD